MKLAGSIGAFANLALPEAARRLARLGVDYIHVDCNGDTRIFDDIAVIRDNANLPIDLHIVSREPERFLPLIERFQIEQASFQYETAGRVPAIDRNPGARLGLALTVETSLDIFANVADGFHYLMLMMTVPGQSGGAFAESAYDRVRDARRRFPGKELHVDGGVNSDVSARLRECGVDCVISGSFLSKAPSLGDAVMAIKNSGKADCRVRDLMLPRNALPILRKDSLNLRDVLKAIDKYKIGLVLVVDKDDMFCGMITDGDVRRGILGGGGEPGLPDAASILNRDPLTVSVTHTMRDVLRAIEAVQRPILFIPVLENGQLAGGIGLHEILGGTR